MKTERNTVGKGPRPSRDEEPPGTLSLVVRAPGQPLEIAAARRNLYTTHGRPQLAPLGPCAQDWLRDAGKAQKQDPSERDREFPTTGGFATRPRLAVGCGI